MKKQYDIVILGGGMVGTALACALAESPLKIALLDHKAPDISWPIEGFDIRVSALTYASQQILNYIGAWEKMKHLRVTPFNDMHVWDATGKGSIHFSSADIGAQQLGHIVENRVTLAALFDVLKSKKNVDYIEPVVATAFTRINNEAQLTLSDNRCISSKLIIGADGARSWLRNQTGIQINTRDYEQKGVVATVQFSGTHENTARQRFLPTGPLAFLPLSDNYCSIVWSTNHDEASRLLQISEHDFLSELQQAIGHTPMEDMISISPRAAFPLHKQHAETYCQPHLALIGDAAHTIHPLAGQGVNLGLLDAATLAEEILVAYNNHKNFADYLLLRRYERRRKTDNTLMLTAMDGFHLLFANENKLLSTIRNIGLGVTDKLSPIKTRFIEHAMGLDRKIPLVHLNGFNSYFAQTSS